MTDGDLELRVAWERHLGHGEVSARWRESVVARYREQHRHYHGVRHLKWVARHVAELAAAHPVADLDAVVAAAFFHDAVYAPGSGDNEAASARLAVTALGELGWSVERTSSAERMILGTVDHRVEGVALDDAVLYAADLGILAADPARYSAYVRAVRREYAHVAEPDWVVGRAAVLRSFIDRDAIYAAVLELDAWEQRARGNLRSELESLTA
jgi:predicted metal-dependent HD superfamily phosphohydrolase